MSSYSSIIAWSVSVWGYVGLMCMICMIGPRPVSFVMWRSYPAIGSLSLFFCFCHGRLGLGACEGVSQFLASFCDSFEYCGFAGFYYW